MLPRLNFGVARNILEPGKPIQVLAELGMDLTTDGRRNTLINSSTFSMDPRLGLEGSYKNTVFLRAGVGNFQRVLDDRDTLNQDKYTIYQPSVGIGVRVNKLMVDYAFTSLQAQANPLYTHIVSIRVLFDKPASKKETPTETAPITTPQ